MFPQCSYNPENKTKQNKMFRTFKKHSDLNGNVSKMFLEHIIVSWNAVLSVLKKKNLKRLSHAFLTMF